MVHGATLHASARHGHKSNGDMHLRGKSPTMLRPARRCSRQRSAVSLTPLPPVRPWPAEPGHHPAPRPRRGCCVLWHRNRTMQRDAETSGRSCSEADGSPDSICDRIRVISPEERAGATGRARSGSSSASSLGLSSLAIAVPQLPQDRSARPAGRVHSQADAVSGADPAASNVPQAGGRNIARRPTRGCTGDSPEDGT